MRHVVMRIFMKVGKTVSIININELIITNNLNIFNMKYRDIQDIIVSECGIKSFNWLPDKNQITLNQANKIKDMVLKDIQYNNITQNTIKHTAQILGYILFKVKEEYKKDINYLDWCFNNKLT